MVASGAPLNEDLLLDFQTQYGAQLIGSTVIRIRGTILWNYTAAEAVGITTVVGIREYNEGHLATEEGPITDPHADWMMYRSTQLGANLEYSQSRYEFDVKSQRKIEELGQGLMVSFEHTGASAYSVAASFSVGLKLP